ncbi:MAG: hypothetical protein FWG22_01350, partial [Prolixibacteraceae bacterium]|nr:hypothetical protein [Prolixibacteraceae bacterium]
QGSNMALPIWGYFMKKVLADPSLKITEDATFERPSNFNVNLDCGGPEAINTSGSREEDDFF